MEILVKNIDMDIPINNGTLTIVTTKRLFIEILKEKQKAILGIVSSNTSASKLSMQLKYNTNQKINDKKIKGLKMLIENFKENTSKKE